MARPPQQLHAAQPARSGAAAVCEGRGDSCMLEPTLQLEDSVVECYGVEATDSIHAGSSAVADSTCYTAGEPTMWREGFFGQASTLASHAELSDSSPQREQGRRSHHGGSAGGYTSSSDAGGESGPSLGIVQNAELREQLERMRAPMAEGGLVGGHEHAGSVEGRDGIGVDSEAWSRRRRARQERERPWRRASAPAPGGGPVVEDGSMRPRGTWRHSDLMADAAAAAASGKMLIPGTPEMPTGLQYIEQFSRVSADSMHALHHLQVQAEAGGLEHLTPVSPPRGLPTGSLLATAAAMVARSREAHAVQHRQTAAEPRGDAPVAAAAAAVRRAAAAAGHFPPVPWMPQHALPMPGVLEAECALAEELHAATLMLLQSRSVAMALGASAAARPPAGQPAEAPPHPHLGSGSESDFDSQQYDEYGDQFDDYEDQFEDASPPYGSSRHDDDSCRPGDDSSRYPVSSTHYPASSTHYPCSSSHIPASSSCYHGSARRAQRLQHAHNITSSERSPSPDMDGGAWLSPQTSSDLSETAALQSPSAMQLARQEAVPYAATTGSSSGSAGDWRHGDPRQHPDDWHAAAEERMQHGQHAGQDSVCTSASGSSGGSPRELPRRERPPLPPRGRPRHLSASGGPGLLPRHRRGSNGSIASLPALMVRGDRSDPRPGDAPRSWQQGLSALESRADAVQLCQRLAQGDLHDGPADRRADHAAELAQWDDAWFGSARVPNASAPHLAVSPARVAAGAAVRLDVAHLVTADTFSDPMALDAQNSEHLALEKVFSHESADHSGLEVMGPVTRELPEKLPHSVMHGIPEEHTTETAVTPRLDVLRGGGSRCVGVTSHRSAHHVSTGESTLRTSSRTDSRADSATFSRRTTSTGTDSYAWNTYPAYTYSNGGLQPPGVASGARGTQHSAAIDDDSTDASSSCSVGGGQELTAVLLNQVGPSVVSAAGSPPASQTRASARSHPHSLIAIDKPGSVMMSASVKDLAVSVNPPSAVRDVGWGAETTCTDLSFDGLTSPPGGPAVELRGDKPAAALRLQHSLSLTPVLHQPKGSARGSSDVLDGGGRGKRHGRRMMSLLSSLLGGRSAAAATEKKGPALSRVSASAALMGSRQASDAPRAASRRLPRRGDARSASIDLSAPSEAGSFLCGVGGSGWKSRESACMAPKKWCMAPQDAPEEQGQEEDGAAEMNTADVHMLLQEVPIAVSGQGTARGLAWGPARRASEWSANACAALPCIMLPASGGETVSRRASSNIPLMHGLQQGEWSAVTSALAPMQGDESSAHAGGSSSTGFVPFAASDMGGGGSTRGSQRGSQRGSLRGSQWGSQRGSQRHGHDGGSGSGSRGRRAGAAAMSIWEAETLPASRRGTHASGGAGSMLQRCETR